jgi:hypothetical protein
MFVMHRLPVVMVLVLLVLRFQRRQQASCDQSVAIRHRLRWEHAIPHRNVDRLFADDAMNALHQVALHHLFRVPTLRPADERRVRANVPVVEQQV